MKTVLFFALFISNIAFATSIRITTMAQLSSVDYNVRSVKVDNIGTMTVVTNDWGQHRLQLSEANQQELMNAVQLLADAEIENETRTMVCKMMIAPFMIQNLSVYSPGTDGLKLVLSGNSCALSNVSYPKEAYAKEAAENLKQMLIVLARQAVN